MTEQTVFPHAEAMRRFTLGQNKRVELWLAQNWERVGLNGPVHKTTISHALNGRPVSADLVRALNTLYGEMRDDPWAWCAPPRRLEQLADYAPLQWWYDTLGLHDIPLTMWKRIGTHNLSPDRLQIVKQRFDDWERRLRWACDQFKADRALVRALEADDAPEYQVFRKIDGEWHAGAAGPWEQGIEETWRGRVGHPGLNGRPLDEVGMAIALEETEITLPDIERACLTYTRPEPVPVTEWKSEPVEPFMGDEFEGFEIVRHELQGLEYHDPLRGKEYVDTKWRVRFYWDGQRYAVEDVEPFAQMKNGRDELWFDTSPADRDFFITGLRRKLETREELLARKDQWIEEVWAGQKESWTESPASFQGRFNQVDFPEGVPRSCAEDAFEAHLGRVDQKAAEAELLKTDRLRRKFMRSLRRRPKGTVLA